MAFPSDLVRTKNWGTEVLTDSDLEGQYDIIINWVMAALNATTGHNHDGSSNNGPEINITNLTVASQALGDLIYASSASAWARKAGNTTTTKKFLNQTGDGSASAAPSWDALTTADISGLVGTADYTDVTDTNNADETFSSGTYADTALSITFTVGKAGLTFASFSGLSNGAAGDTGYYALLVDGTVVQEVAAKSTGGTQNFPISLTYVGKLTAASHTIKIQCKRGAAGTETLLGATVTSRLRVSHPS